MDVSGLTNAYSEYIENQAKNSSANSLKATVINKDFSNSTDEEMMEACKEFESYFLEQVFKEMEKSVDIFKDKDDQSAGSTTMLDYFKDQAIQKISAMNTEQNSLGLAQTLFEQMKRNYTAQTVITNDEKPVEE